MSLELRLELLSDAAPGSGAAGPDVDNDVVTDDDGLPTIPGRRLKGLLREACLEIHEAFSLAGDTAWLTSALCPTTALFGTPDQAGLIRVGDARLAAVQGDDGGLAAAEQFRAWLLWARDSTAGAALRPAEVLDALSVVRRQTAIDPDTGTARRHALRSMRLLRRGLRFAGPVALAPAPRDLEQRARRTLAIACAAFRRLGTARHRGPGHVRVHLWDTAVGDLTTTTLARLDAPDPKGATA